MRNTYRIDSGGLVKISENAVKGGLSPPDIRFLIKRQEKQEE